MQAIETTYNGIKFRSRLEARWAVFLDELGVPYSYEAEGYELPSGRYLPDFWLPTIPAFLEIKGQLPTDDEQRKARELAAASGHRVFIAYGDIAHIDVGRCYIDGIGDIAGVDMYDAEGDDPYYWWCICQTCGRIGIEFAGRSERICRHTTSDRGHNGSHPRIVRAQREAAGRRFWNPAT